MKENSKVKNLITSYGIAGVILGLALLNIVVPEKDYSYSERRALNKFPTFSLENIMDGSFMKDFEAASVDRFVGRDIFRSINSISNRYLLGMKDNHGFYYLDGFIGKGEELNLSRVDRNLATLREIYEAKIKGTDCNTYICIIPDKNMYLQKKAEEESKIIHPGIDYDYLYDYIYEYSQATALGEWIDIRNELQPEDYYRTDQHWRQERIEGVAKKVAEALKVDVEEEYDIKTLDKLFYGTYYGQAALPIKGESLSYLNNEILDQCIVTSMSSGVKKAISIYTMSKAESKDPYEIFLGGADPFITIENPAANTGKELIVFRDSFGSSLVPLLVPGYSKITMIDLRYMQKEMLNSFVEFSNQDVLYLYSSLILNNSLSK